jgi:hypothetical protein
MATTSKPYDKTLPFTRINSPSENLLPTRLSGDGHTRGTRREGDFYEQALIDKVVRKLILLTPSWTTTRGTTERDVEQEIQGKMARSFQTWTDAPPFQWHRWYDWNFHLEPDAGYDWLRGMANHATSSGELPKIVNHNPFNSDPTGRNQYVVFGSVMECEWDTGAFAPDTMQRPGPMFDADWAWPMANQRVWLVGRSIYDGGHETSAGICRSELHPCKAVASARWEAFNFKENNGGQAGGRVFTPAIQFQFFASRFGGYVDYPDIKPADGQPYQFIVDLPEAPAGSTARMAVGGTPDTPMNTVVLRSNQLLQHFDRARFSNTRNGPTAANVDPIVQLLPEDPAHPRLRQAKVTLPLAALTGDCYGVLVSLGWRDLSGEQAARVKKCTVKMKKLFKASIDHDTFSEEWRVKAGVNGRWFQWNFTGVRNNTEHSLARDEKNRPTELVIHLHEDDALQFSAHGAELDLVDDVYMGSNRDRTVTVSNDDINIETSPGDTPLSHSGSRKPVDWRTQVDIRPPATKSPASYPVQRAIARRIFSLMWQTFNDQNDPIGLIDAVSTAPLREQPHNPLRVGPAVGLGERTFSLTGYQTWEEGTSAELLERPHRANADASRSNWIDYRIELSVKVENQ